MYERLHPWMNLAEVKVVAGGQPCSVQRPSLARLDGCCDTTVEGPIWNGQANADAFEVDNHLSSVRGNCVLVVAVVCPRDNTALTNGCDPGAKLEGA